MRWWPLARRRRALPLPSEDLLVTEERLRLAAADVFFVRERQIRGPVVMFHGDLEVPPAGALDALTARFSPLGYTPVIKREGDDVVVQAWPAVETMQPPRHRRALVLFALTLISTFLAGAYYVGSPTFDRFGALPFPAWALGGFPFAVTLLSILGVHELGHYFTARHHRASVSLPYFLPLPPIPIPIGWHVLGWLPFIPIPAVWVGLPTFGTLGAIIRMRSLVRDRNAMFDIAAAGPLAGLCVAIPALVLGLHWSHVVPGDAAHRFGGFGHSLLTQLFVYLQFGSTSGLSVMTHPVADAAWVGCFVTALNLIPVGQLDGGRIVYALSSRRHRVFGQAAWIVLIALGLYTHSPNWFAWAALIFFLVGFDHSPPANDMVPLTLWRRLLGVVCLVFVVLLIPPIPV